MAQRQTGRDDNNNRDLADDENIKDSRLLREPAKEKQETIEED